MRKVCVLLLTCLLFAGLTPSKKPPFYFAIHRPGELKNLLRWSPDRIPLVSAHRGGPAPGFPENCIATFENTLQHTHALIEFDVRVSKDDSLVVMHDETVNRTTNGTGFVHELTFTQLKALRLRDNQGNLTQHRIPALSEVLQWAKGKTILKLDPKRTVADGKVARYLQRFGAQNYTLIITYTADQAATYYHLDSSLVLSVNIRQESDLAQLSEAGIPDENMIAFLGVSEPSDSLYQLLHQRNISCVLGTIGPIDHKARRTGNKLYRQLLRQGADVLATDFPEPVAEAIQKVSPPVSSKLVYFQ